MKKRSGSENRRKKEKTKTLSKDLKRGNEPTALCPKEKARGNATFHPLTAQTS